MAIYAQCEVQIVELKRLTNVIILFLLLIKRVFVGANLNTSRYFLLFHKRIFVSLIMCFCSLSSFQPPDYSPSVLHLKVKDMIEHCKLICFFKKMKESTHKQITCIHNYPVIICCIVYYSLYHMISCSFLTLWMLWDVFWTRQLSAVLDGGDSYRTVPMAISSEEITLHSSSLK